MNKLAPILLLLFILSSCYTHSQYRSNYTKSDLILHQIEGTEYLTVASQIEKINNCINNVTGLTNLLADPYAIKAAETNLTSHNKEQLLSRKILSRPKTIDIKEMYKRDDSFMLLVCVNTKGVPLLSKLISNHDDHVKEKTILKLNKAVLNGMSYEEDTNAPCLACGKYSITINLKDLNK